jgi:glycosyltransferase involved in cell wall biosynthesis
MLILIVRIDSGRFSEMKVAMLCSRFPPAPGGAEMHILELSRELERRGHMVSILTSDMYCDTPLVRMGVRKEIFKGIVRRSKSITMPGEADFPVYPGVLLDALAEKTDIIHVHGYGCFHTLLTPLLKKIKRTRTVFTLHFHPDESDWGGSRRLMLRRFYDRNLGALSTGFADALIVHTAHEKRLLAKFGLISQKSVVHVIPSGIDISKFSSNVGSVDFQARFGIGNNERIVLFVGRLALKKGLETLVECAPMVLSKIPHVKFVIVGEDMGLGLQIKKEVKRRGLNGSFLFTGYLPEDSMLVSAYNACDLLVLPSEYEAFGLVLAEAMACGKPCVACRVGGVPEVIDHERTGLLVPPRDPVQLADAIIRVLLNSEDAIKMGRSGRQKAVKEYSISTMTDRILEVYSAK